MNRVTSAGPYRLAWCPTSLEERYRLRLDGALSCALRRPDQAFWLALDVLIDTAGRYPAVATAAEALLRVLTPR